MTQGTVRKDGVVQGAGPPGLFRLFHPVLQLTQPRVSPGEGQKVRIRRGQHPGNVARSNGRPRARSHLTSALRWREVAHGFEQ